MSGDEQHQNERQAILTRLLDAVKQCQVRFGGRSELATDSDSRVSCLCAAWEAALQHGMRKNSKALSALKHMTERTGLAKVTDLFSDIRKIETEPAFWHYTKEHLTKHEFQRFSKLKLVNSDYGRGRAWLRASLNEHSLERYMHMLIESDEMLKQHYEDWAFLRDLERSSMLPNMAAGLGSILFAITVDRPELNKGVTTQNSIHVQNSIDSVGDSVDEPKAVISGDVSPATVKRKEKKKKKKIPNIVSFDEDDTMGTVITKTGSVSTAASEEGVADICSHTNETRENGEGSIQEDNVFMPENPEMNQTGSPIAKEETSSTDARVSLMNTSQVSTPSLLSGNSDRLSKSSQGSFSDLDHDNGTFMSPVNSDGVVMDSDMVPLNASSKPRLPEPQRGSLVSENMRQGDIESASLALALAQQSLTNTSRRMGDGGDREPVQTMSHGDMSHSELKQAVIAMMLRKDSVEESNRKLDGMLQHEMEISSTLRAEIEELKTQHTAQHDKEQAKIQALIKENELLKHQLKKYVSAVQMLRTEGINKEDTLGIHLEEPQPSIPPPKPMIDYSHEAAEYEKKLIQVAEMHGELMEFNEQLHRQMSSKDAKLKQLREELVTLRGPLPYENQISNDSGPDLEGFSQQRTLINIWIPSAFLRGSAGSTHHVYQVYVRIKDEEWNVYRRYSQFHDMHVRLKKVYPLVGKFEFPAKKAIGKKDAKLVESRRQQFQSYLRNVINIVMERSDALATNANKEKLISYLPFFSDKADEGGKQHKKGSRSSNASASLPFAVPEGATGNSELRRDAHYQGL